MENIADYYALQQVGEMWDEINIKKPKLHKCKDGSIVDIRGISKKYPRMTDSHLLNTINYIKRKAKEGVTIYESGGGVDLLELWYYEKTIYGKEVLKHLKYKHYIKEAEKRQIL